MNTQIQSLKVWLKSTLPWLKYSIFFYGIVLFGAPCTVIATVVLIAQAVFLLEHGHTDTYTQSQTQLITLPHASATAGVGYIQSYKHIKQAHQA